MKMLNKMTLSAASGLLLGCSPLAQAGSADSVVVLQYHHVSDSTPAVTSIDPDTFREHLQYLQDNNFNVIDITVARDAIEKGEELPEKAVVITFDDGYQNVYENAVELLEEFEMPYTVFVNPELMRKHSSHYMGWDELKGIQQNGATIANHGQTHAHLIRKQEGESDEAWRDRMHYDIVTAQDAIDENLGEQEKYFAYPYGEYNNELRNLMDEWGFLGFAQHSGSWSRWSDNTVITRFPASGLYANLNTLKAKLNSKAMPVSAYEPKEPLVAHENSRPTISVTLQEGDTLDDMRTGALQCFASGSVIQPDWETEARFSVTLDQDINIGRSRINCTAPSASESRYYWYSVALIRPDQSGSWPD